MCIRDRDNPWDTFEQNYSVGKITDGKVVRIIEKGIIAELPSHVDGFVPTTQLSTSKIKNVANHFLSLIHISEPTRPY